MAFIELHGVLSIVMTYGITLASSVLIPHDGVNGRIHDDVGPLHWQESEVWDVAIPLSVPLLFPQLAHPLFNLDAKCQSSIQIVTREPSWIAPTLTFRLKNFFLNFRP